MYSSIRFERKADIAVITLNRPRVLNALSRALKGELSDALGRVAKDPDIRAVVLIGAGKARTGSRRSSASASSGTSSA